MGNEDGKIEIGVGVNTEELDKYSKKLDKILKQMQQVNGTTVKSTSSVKNLDDKTKKLRENASKTVSGNGSRGLSLSTLLNKIPEYSKLSGSLGNIGSGVNRIKESVSFSRDGTRNIQNKTEHLSKSFEKLSTKTNVAQARLGAVAEKGGVVGKAAGGLSKGFSKLGPLIARIGGLLARVGVALGPIGIALGVVAGVIGGVILAITGMIAATAIATEKMKEFASQADKLVKERRSYDPTTATEAGAYRQGLIRQTGKLTDKLGRLSTTLANSDVIKFSGTLDIMRRRYSDVDNALDRHAKTTMRVTAFMDTLGMYLDSLKMGVLDLIEPIVSNTELLKGLATAIDVVTTPLMWIGKGLSIFAQKIGEVLSVIGNLIFSVVQFVAEIPILGDFVKDAMKALDAKSSHAARDFVDDMENVFKKYEAGYYKDPYKLNTGLHNLSFMDYQAERSPANNDVPTDDKEITDVNNNSLMHILKTNFLKLTKPLLDSGFILVGNIVERLDTIFTFIKKTAETIFYFWTTLFQEAHGIVTKAKEFFEGIVTKAKEYFGGIVTNAKTFFEGIVTKAKEFFGGIVTNAKTFFEGIVTKAKEYFGGIVTKVKEFFEGIVTKAETFFKPLLDGVSNICNLINSVITAIQNIKINIPFVGSSNSSSSSSSKKDKEPLPEPTISPSPAETIVVKPSSSNGAKALVEEMERSKSKGKLTSYSGRSGNSNSNSVASSNNQASNETTPPKAYLKNLKSFAQVPNRNNNAFALPETQASASAKNSNKSLELANSHRLPYTDWSKELKILDPRNVDIKININTEKADKDFVEKMTEKLKKSFLEGLLYDY
jgi:phage-related protein